MSRASSAQGAGDIERGAANFNNYFRQKQSGLNVAGMGKAQTRLY
jgi:hypothetical protein